MASKPPAKGASPYFGSNGLSSTWHRKGLGSSTVFQFFLLQIKQLS